jgi:RHS repeat-associated protein
LADGTVVTYAYDDDSRLATVTAGGVTTSYGYDAASNPLTTALPNGVTKTVTYDRAGRIATLASAKGATAIAGYTYTRDPNGNPTSIVATGANVAGTRVMTYDTVDRLLSVCSVTTVACPVASGTTWTYNKVGSRATQNEAGVASTYTYDNADELISSVTGAVTTAYTYDSNGNQLTAGARVSTYNAAMQTVSVKEGAAPVTTYTYDGGGNRLTATNNAVVSKFQWDRQGGLPMLAVERDPANVVTRRYVNGLEPISLSTPTGTSYYVTDELGSVTHVTNGTTGAVQWANKYSPYGTDVSVKVDPAAPTNPLMYTGQYKDSASQYNLRARLYNPTLGSFTQTDPLQPIVDVAFPSAYVYANNNPLMFTDPSGLRSIDGIGLGKNPIRPCRPGFGEAPTELALLSSVTPSLRDARNPHGFKAHGNNCDNLWGKIMDFVFRDRGFSSGGTKGLIFRMQEMLIFGIKGGRVEFESINRNMKDFVTV